MIKVGIFGSGFGLYGLLPAFNTIPKCKVTCIYGEKTERLTNYCKGIGLKKIYTNWQEMMNQEDLDAIAIAVPPFLQYEIAKVAIYKGVHIFAEKPLAVDYQQASELYRLAKKADIINAVDFEFCEIRQWSEVKKYIDNKTYGLLKQINLNWNFQSYDIKNNIKSWKTDNSKGGGALSFYFSHCLFYLEYFAGKIFSLKSKLSYSKESLNNGEVGVDIIMNFQNQITGYAHLRCDVVGINQHQLTFIFEKGTVVLENINGSYTDFRITIYTDIGVREIVPKKVKRKNEDERAAIVNKLATRFIKSVVAHIQFYPSFKEGLRVEQLIDIIKKNQNV